MITENILQYIPQRPPFIMVDKLLYADLEKATSNLTITNENIFSEDGYFSEAGLLENIAQTVAAGNGFNEQQANKKASGGFIAGVKNFQVFFLPKVNEVLTTDIVVAGKIFNMTTITGKIMCNSELVAQCEMKIFSNAND